MSSSKPIGVRRVNRWTRNLAQRLEDHYFEALAFSRHNIDLVFDEEKMQPEKITKAPDNAGIDLSSMRGSKWYQESTREDDDPVLHLQDERAMFFTGTNRMSYQIREPIEHDEEKLAMKRGDTPPPLPERVDNPRIRETQAQMEFYSNSDKIHHATLKTNSHKHGLIMADLSSCLPAICEEKQVHTLNFITCQRTSAAFSSTREPEQAFCQR